MLGSSTCFIYHKDKMIHGHSNYIENEQRENCPDCILFLHVHKTTEAMEIEIGLSPKILYIAIIFTSDAHEFLGTLGLSPTLHSFLVCGLQPSAAFSFITMKVPSWTQI
jgi:hypothetical protein